jgi:hypothetical protein
MHTSLLLYSSVFFQPVAPGFDAVCFFNDLFENGITMRNIKIQMATVVIMPV